MNPAGALLDTGPLVALLSRTDANHERAKALFGSYAPPFRTCEAVLVEASHLLSKDDRAEDVQEKIEEYLTFGVKYVWIINHRKRLAYIHTAAGMIKAEGGILRTSNPDIVVPIAEIWPKWKRS